MYDAESVERSRRAGSWKAWLAGAAVIVALTVVAAGDAADGSWERVASPAFAGSGSNIFVNGVVARSGAQPWLAVGYLVHPDGRREPVVWESRDGRRWERRKAEEDPAAAGRQRLFRVARRGDTAVAFGLTPSASGAQRPTAWRSVAGGPWRLVRGDEPPFNDDSTVEQVRVVGDGFLAVGARRVDDESTAAGVWTSTDGEHWVAIDHPALAGSSGELVTAFGVAGNAGRIVVVGDSRLDLGRAGRHAAVWTGSGTTWERVRDPDSGLDGWGAQAAADVTAFGPKGFVAVGVSIVNGHSAPTAWSTTDGRRWRQSLLTNGKGADARLKGGAFSVFVRGGRVLVVGQIAGSPRLWSSSDGRRWREEPLTRTIRSFPDYQQMTMAASGSGMLLVLQAENRPELWLGGTGGWQEVTHKSDAFPAAGADVGVVGFAQAGSTLVAVGNAEYHVGGYRGVVWTSRDGREWAKVPPGPLGPAGIADAVSTPAGALVAGTSSARGRWEPAVWTSRDGRTWKTTRVGSYLRGGIISLVATDRAVHALVGGYETAAKGKFNVSLWSSTNGRSWRRTGIVSKDEGSPVDLCLTPKGFLAVGSIDDALVIWESVDGRRWVKAYALGPGTDPAACAVDERGLAVVVGRWGGQAATFVRFPGGQFYGGPAVGALGPSTPARVLRDIVVTENGFLAIGSDSWAGQLDLGVWRSWNGTTWERVGVPESVFREPGLDIGIRASSYAGRLLIGGIHGTGAGIWLGPGPTE